jgi:hypothetical protein
MIKSEHQRRANVIHAVAAELDLKAKDWSKIDTQLIGDIKEEVQVGFEIATGPILMAAVAAFKVWVNRKKIQSVEIEDKEGTRVLLKGITHSKLKSIIDKLGLSKPKIKSKIKAKGRAKSKTISRKSVRKKRY